MVYLVGVWPEFLVVGGGGFFRRLLLPLRSSPEEDVIDEGVFQQGQEHEDEAAHQVHVYGFHVGDLGKGLSQVRVNGGHGQHGGDTWSSKESKRNEYCAQLKSVLFRKIYNTSDVITQFREQHDCF